MNTGTSSVSAERPVRTPIATVPRSVYTNTDSVQYTQRLSLQTVFPFLVTDVHSGEVHDLDRVRMNKNSTSHCGQVTLVAVT